MSSPLNRKKRVTKIMSKQDVLLKPQNYMLLGLAVLLLAVGFGGMYIENEYKGWFSLYISPILLVAGFITVVFAIMKKWDTNQEQSI